MIAQVPHEDVLRAAETGLLPYLEKVPLDRIEQYGFVEGDVLQSATLGAPFLLHTITPEALERHLSGTPVAAMITPTSMWYFPVLIEGQARAVLVVDRLDDQWKAVSLGYAGLARELGMMSRQWPRSEGYDPVLIAVFQARQYLFTVPARGADNLTPLTPISKTRDDRYSGLADASDVIAGLKPVVLNAVGKSK